MLTLLVWTITYALSLNYNQWFVILTIKWKVLYIITIVYSYLFNVILYFIVTDTHIWVVHRHLRNVISITPIIYLNYVDGLIWVQINKNSLLLSLDILSLCLSSYSLRTIKRITITILCLVSLNFTNPFLNYNILTKTCNLM